MKGWSFNIEFKVIPNLMSVKKYSLLRIVSSLQRQRKISFKISQFSNTATRISDKEVKNVFMHEAIS